MATQKANWHKDDILSVSMIASTFGFDRRTIANKLKNIESIPGVLAGGRDGYLPQKAVPAIYAQHYYAEDAELKPTDRNAWFDSEHKRFDLEVKQGNYIASDDVHKYLAKIFKEMDVRLSTLSDNVEREEGLLSVEQIKSLERHVNKIRGLLISAITDGSI